MTLNRYARKSDTAQPAIVSELRKLGVQVEIIGKPVDLLCRISTYPPNYWRLVEIKTPRKSGKLSVDKRQITQNEFCLDNRVPKLTTTEQVLQYLKTT